MYVVNEDLDDLEKDDAILISVVWDMLRLFKGDEGAVSEDSGY